MSHTRARPGVALVRLALALLLTAGLLATGCAPTRYARGLADDFAGDYRTHAVAADHPLASRAGLEALRAGGNAVDAAVATSFALSVVRPFSCGIGGGGFMVIHFPGGDGAPDSQRPPVQPSARATPRGEGAMSIAINYREMAPGASTPDMFAREGQPSGAASPSRAGGLAPAIPGTVAGLLHAHELYGRLSREQVLAPAVRLAERGFTADEAYVRAVASVSRDFAEHPEWQTRFAFVWERYLHRGRVAVGDLIHVPEQGEALRLIARDGAGAFYDGPIGEALVRAVRGDGGIITREDLRGYHVARVEPLRFDVQGPHAGTLHVLTMPPPSSGGITMAQALGILANRRRVPEAGTAGATGTRWVGPGVPLSSDLLGSATLIEAFKLAFADRAAWLGDPDFVDIPIDRLLSDDYLRQRAGLIDDARTLPPDHYLDPGARIELSKDAGTSHLCVVDRWGNAVACTETINLEFGSLLAVPEYGFILNDQMDDFTSRVGEPNAFGLRQSARNLPAPAKRPLSSMTPTIVLDADGAVWAVAGASGGPRIITGTTLGVLDAINMVSARDAVAAPRFHHQWLPDRLDLEPALALMPTPPASPGRGRTFADAMRARGHEVREIERLCVLQMIRRGEHHGWQAASDPRKGGRPAGD